MIQTSTAKHTQNRARHYAATRQDWRESNPYLELDDCTIAVEDAPSPCPPGQRTVDSFGMVERRGAVVVAPSPSISKGVNRRAAAFWRRHGFEYRTPENSPHFVEGYVKEWVRPCDKPGMDGKRYGAKAWLDWVNKKHKELYC